MAFGGMAAKRSRSAAAALAVSMLIGFSNQSQASRVHDPLCDTVASGRFAPHRSDVMKEGIAGIRRTPKHSWTPSGLTVTCIVLVNSNDFLVLDTVLDCGVYVGLTNTDHMRFLVRTVIPAGGPRRTVRWLSRQRTRPPRVWIATSSRLGLPIGQIRLLGFEAACA
jgi:hypothetical protein